VHLHFAEISRTDAPELPIQIENADLLLQVAGVNRDTSSTPIRFVL
jgi:hypothetical protein